MNERNKNLTSAKCEIKMQVNLASSLLPTWDKVRQKTITLVLGQKTLILEPRA